MRNILLKGAERHRAAACAQGGRRNREPSRACARAKDTAGRMRVPELTPEESDTAQGYGPWTHGPAQE